MYKPLDHQELTALAAEYQRQKAKLTEVKTTITRVLPELRDSIRSVTRMDVIERHEAVIMTIQTGIIKQDLNNLMKAVLSLKYQLKFITSQEYEERAIKND